MHTTLDRGRDAVKLDVDGRQPPPPPAPPAPAVRPGSTLHRLALSAAVLAVGLVATADLAGASVRTSAYFAAPLAVIGLGLIVGARYGHARALIVPGLVLTVIVAMLAGAGANTGRNGEVTWRPTGIEQLQRSYDVNVGDAVLDLTEIDFAGRSATVDIHVAVGNLEVIVPPTVDVTVRAAVDVGNAAVFGQRHSGLNQDANDVLDVGTDGAGGGALSLRATVGIGDLEVRR